MKDFQVNSSRSSREYKTITALIAILRDRGLLIEEIPESEHYLHTIGHYRLSDFYPIFFETSGIKKFYPDSSLREVIDLYSFDRRLRLLLLGPLEKIEVALRALLTMELGDYATKRERKTPVQIELFNPQYYDLSSNHKRRVFRIAEQSFFSAAKAKWLQNEGKFARDSNGQLVKGLRRDEQNLQFQSVFSGKPAWEILQTGSFTPLAHLFSLLRPEIGDAIANRFELPTRVLSSIIYGLRDLRNACAHHEPIWNWDPTQRSGGIKFPARYFEAADISHAANVSGDGTKTIYAYCAVIHILLSYLSMGRSTWYRRLKKLINEFNTIPSEAMGFPPYWQTLPFWCVADVRKTAGFETTQQRIATYRKLQKI